MNLKSNPINKINSPNQARTKESNIKRRKIHNHTLIKEKNNSQTKMVEQSKKENSSKIESIEKKSNWLMN